MTFVSFEFQKMFYLIHLNKMYQIRMFSVLSMLGAVNDELIKVE